MTGNLRELMQERTDRLHPARVDLDAILADGDRRVRRRRRLGIAGAVGTVAAVVAVAAVAGGIGPLGSGPGRTKGIEGQVAGPGSHAFTYAVGSVVHIGDSSIDVGRAVDAMVQTSSGVVFSALDGSVWSADETAVTRLGTVVALPASTSRLEVDDSGEHVAWLDGSGKSLVLRVYTVSSGDLQTASVENPAPQTWPPSVRAISAGTVYLADARGLVGYDIETGQVDVVDVAAGDEVLVDAAAGRFLHRVDSGTGSETEAVGLAVTASMGEDSPVITGLYNSGYLSPDATLIASEDFDDVSVFVVATGERLDLRHPGFEFAAPVVWIDNDHLAALALPTLDLEDPISLLTCRVSTTNCEVSVPNAGVYPDVVVPMGESLRDQ